MKENILLIMCDQLRFDYLEYINPLIKTPNINKLAQKSVIFKNCYTNSPICAPARISLATGLHPIKSGCLENETYLSIHEDTYYKRLRDSGYKVGCVGKLDLAKPTKENGVRGDRPVLYSYGFTHPVEIEGKQHAFSSSENELLGPYADFLKKRGKLEKFTDKDYIYSGENWVQRNSFVSNLLPEEFHDSYIGARACEWIEKADPEYPWHLFVSFAGPHNPYDAHEDYIKQVSDEVVDTLMPIVGNSENKPNAYIKHLGNFAVSSTDEKDIKKAIKQYIAYILMIDEQIGKIIETLEKNSMLDNTWIMFTADHGEMLGDHGLYTKHCAYEGSLHIPLFAYKKGVEPHITDTFVELMDVGETICDIACARTRQGRKADAFSFLDTIKDESRKHRDYIVAAETSQNGVFRCIKTADYKFISNFGDLPELYDVKNDPKELNNIANSNPKIVAEYNKLIYKDILSERWE